MCVPKDLVDTAYSESINFNRFLHPIFETWDLRIQGAKHYNWVPCEPIDNCHCCADADQADCSFDWSHNSFFKPHIVDVWYDYKYAKLETTNVYK